MQENYKIKRFDTLNNLTLQVNNTLQNTTKDR
jgi:hypothetical protein